MEDPKPQPQKGDVVLHCGHTGRAPLHWWRVEDMFFRRPDGSEAEARWMVGCDPCLVAAGGDVLKLRIVADSVWPGGDPIDFKKPD